MIIPGGPMLTKDQLIKITLATFEGERNHSVTDNLKVMDEEFAVTDMIMTTKGNFPRLSGEKLRSYMKEAFKINGRHFIFQTVLADTITQTVIVEFIESYPDSKTKKIFRTPQVAICQFKNGRLYRTRHYMDPRLSFEYLEMLEIKNAMS